MNMVFSVLKVIYFGKVKNEKKQKGKQKQMGIEAFQIITIALGFLVSFYLFHKSPKLPNHVELKETTQKLSVIIPCRNEEKNIALLLSDLKNQTLSPHEVVVVDDNSSDNTASVANQFGVKVLVLKDKPADYIGKSWALEAGSKESTGELLLFLDADVRLGKHAIAQLLATQNQNNGKVITVQPYHQTNQFYEQFSLPFNLIQLAANRVTTMTGRPFGLYGPVILIPANIYNEIGRHYHVRNSIIEDVSLGMHLTKQGHAFQAYLGKPEIQFRMYADGFKSLVQGWTKNIAFGASKTAWYNFLFIFLFIASVLGSFSGMVSSLAAANYDIAGIYGLFYLLWVIRLQAISKEIGKFQATSFVLYPIPFVGFVIIFVVSMFKKVFRLPVKWKGRFIR